MGYTVEERGYALKILAGFLVMMLVARMVLPSILSEVGFRFEERSREVGLDHVTVYGGADSNRYLLETTGCGSALLDFDNDGDLDVYLVNGRQLEDSPSGREAINHLYRNQGDRSFVDVTEKSGVGYQGWGQAVCVGDYDNDGFEDLFVTYWGQNVLSRNNGDGTFTNTTQAAGLVQQRRRWNSGCAFLDYDRDGDLDLFVANYIDIDLENTPTPDSGLCLYKGIMVACGPTGLKGDENILYRNNNDGTFSDVSAISGVSQANGYYGLGVLTSDFTNDGWVDVYVANDSSPSALYRNNQDGTFTDIGTVAGCSYSQHGRPQAGMGVTTADFNRDGSLDIFKTNFAGDTANLYRNRGESLFEEAAFSSGIAVNTRWLGWGCGFADLDRDGWMDIFQVNGHVYPEVNQLEGEAKYKQPKVVYRNRSGVEFEDVTARVGAAVQVPRAGRGAAFGDYDNDGDIDILVNNVHERSSLYENDSLNDNHWVSLRLRGVKSNRSGIGARVRCRVGEFELLDEVRSGGSFYSQNDLRVHFGLGAAQQVDLLEIIWPGGEVERLVDVAVDRFLEIHQGRGIQSEKKANLDR